MKFIRVGVIQFDLFPRNCELTSAFENSASLIGNRRSVIQFLPEVKIVFFHSTGKTLLLFFFLFDRTVCSCAKQSGVIGKIVDSYFCQSRNVIPFLSHRFLILCRIPFNPIKSPGCFSSRCLKLNGNTALLIEFLFLRQYCLFSLASL